jgi:hypothetical protein
MSPPPTPARAPPAAVAHLPVEPPSVIDGGADGNSGGPDPSSEGYTLGSPEPDVCLIEVGGTVGDIESLVFLEALRQFGVRVGAENICFLHVSLVPVLGSVGEQKTKPTQHSVKELRSVGLSPDVIVCRSARALSLSTRDKLALFCQVRAVRVGKARGARRGWRQTTWLCNRCRHSPTPSFSAVLLVAAHSHTPPHPPLPRRWRPSAC